MTARTTASSSTSSFFSVSLNSSPSPSPSPKPSPFMLQPHGHNLKVQCIQSPPPPNSNPFKPNPKNSSCFDLTFLELVPSKLQCLVDEFKSLSEPLDRVKRLLHYASLLPPLDESARVESNRVMGCTARVWLEVGLDEEGKVRFAADSDSEITKGFCSCLVWVLDGSPPEEVLKVTTDDLVALNVGLPSTGRSRVNTWHNFLVSMQKRTKQLIAEREGKGRFRLSLFLLGCDL